MKKIAAISLILLIAWPLMLKVFVYTAWQINRDYIAKTSCENRNDPTSDCAGSCQLVKQLKNAEPTEKPFTPPAGVEKIELSHFTIAEHTNAAFIGKNNTTIDYRIIDDALFKTEIVFSFFHPPQKLV